MWVVGSEGINRFYDFAINNDVKSERMRVSKKAILEIKLGFLTKSIKVTLWN
jgi:hypothetical protein